MQYTKVELTALMNGYPPWYRERIVCAHGPSTPFPIRNDADITRGGWVVAVGLADSATRTPMALYTVPNLADKQTDGSYLARTKGSHLRIAVQRVYRQTRTSRLSDQFLLLSCRQPLMDTTRSSNISNSEA